MKFYTIELLDTGDGKLSTIRILHEELKCSLHYALNFTNDIPTIVVFTKQRSQSRKLALRLRENNCKIKSSIINI